MNTGVSPARKPAPPGAPSGASNSTEQELREARDYAQAIIETAPPLLVLDPDLRVKTANESFYKHFHVSPPQTEDSPVYELGNGQFNIPTLRTFLEEVLPQRNSFDNFEMTHEFETIGRRTVLLSGRQVDGLQRIILFIDDITERTESRALMASEVRYRRLFEAARDGILILNPGTRRITDANPYMLDLLGCARDELVGKELWEIGLFQDEATSRAAFLELQRNTFIRYQDLTLLNKAGLRHEVEFVSNVYDEDGRKVIQCNIRDITERKAMQNALADAKDRLTVQAADLERVVVERTSQLRESIGELERFSYSVSHDMRAPLRAMQSYSQFLVDEYGGKLDAQGIDYLHQIMRSAVRLDRLTQDVLSYARILHAELPMGSVDLDRLVRDIVEAFPPGRPLEPEIQIKGALPKVVANEALLAQCISNLLNNGAKFVSPGTRPRVEISAEAIDGDWIRVSFKDNGIGIAAEDHPRLFRVFERIQPAAENEGTGIGLTIVRKAAERMGAHVGFESALGRGSNFWIQLKKG
jgi:PAS domain S-box-containing protein